MVFEFGDWRFRVDVDRTNRQTANNSFDHCQCSYCRNFYDTVDQTYPRLRAALGRFGINLEGPSELMPFEPTLMLACYRVYGEIEHWGSMELYAAGIPIVPELSDNGSFLLWVGEFELPWVQEVPVDEVVSPANQPEFLERMMTIWSLRHGNDFVVS